MKVVIESLPRQEREYMKRIAYHDPILGLLLHDIHPDQRYSLGISHDVTGLLVYSVDPQSLAQRAGIIAGDMPITVNKERILGYTSSFKRFTRYFKAMSSVDLGILRKGRPLTFRVELDKK